MRRFSRVACLLAFLVVYDGPGHAQSYRITTYAGPVFPVSGVPATTLSVGSNSVIADAAGGFYVSGVPDSRVYHVTATGTLAVIAGNGSVGFSGDGGPATAAQLNRPTSLALDSIGNLMIADSGNNRVRKVTPGGVISTVVGIGIYNPTGVAVDVEGNLFIATQSRILKVSPSGIITTVAGFADPGFGGDGGPATSAWLNNPYGVAVDMAGNLFIADTFNNRIRKVTPSGVISTVPNGQVYNPRSVAVDATGALFIATAGEQIKKLTPDGNITTVAGTGGAQFGGDGGPAVSAQLNEPYGVAIGAVGDLLIADTSNQRVRKVNSAGIISTVAGNGLTSFSGDGGPATYAQLHTPYGVAVDGDGNVFIADSGNNRVRKVTLSGVISTIAGNGMEGSSGDGGPAISASLSPNGVAVDMAGNLFIATSGRIRKVSPSGIISTVAGGGFGGFGGDGGPATSAHLGFVESVAVDTAGNLLIADYDYGRIRRVDLSGIISTLAGMGNGGFSGDGGPATSALMIGPLDVSTDQSGNLFIADSQNNRIRKVTPSGIISTVAGSNSGFTGNAAFSGDGGPATEALLSDPHGVTVDGDGNLFIADTLNHRIRKVTPSGIISTVAGTGDAGFSGDGGSAAAAQLNFPTDVIVDSKNNLFVADNLNLRIRKLTPVTESRTFSIRDRGGVSLKTSGTETAVMTGYASIQPNIGLPTPSGVAIVGFRQNNVLVSEASTPASSLIRAGRIYAEIDGPVNTGLAIANPNDQPATVSFYFTDARGDFGSGSAVIPAKGQIAKFLNEAPFNGRASLSGTLTFSSSVPVAVIALRGLTNERFEFLITTLPVADLNPAATTGPIVFPHFAAGGGWTTQIILVNPTDTPLTGIVEIRSTPPSPVYDPLSYSVPPRSSQKIQVFASSETVATGSVHLVPSGPNSAAPSGIAIFSFRNGGTIVTEAGVQAVPAGNAFRLYAVTSESIQSGIAVANSSGNVATVTLELSRLDGSSTGLTGTLSIPAGGQTALFLNQVPGFGALPASFQGILRVSSAAPISVIGLRGRYNERSDFLITTTPPVDESAAPITSPLFFPQLADSGGYTTEFILFSGWSGQTLSGTIRLYDQAGGALSLTLQ